MAIAQQLYEGCPSVMKASVGLITYMRTDSTNIAQSPSKKPPLMLKKPTVLSISRPTEGLYPPKPKGGPGSS